MPALWHKLLTYLGFRAAAVQASPQPAARAIAPPLTAAEALQREIRADRTFSIAEAIAREGGSFMKGESTIPRPLRATTAINQFIVTHLNDPAGLSSGALSVTLQTWAKDDIRVSRQLDTPLVALTQIVEGILTVPTTFCEFARQVAIAHSQVTGDRPYFQQPNQPPHPEAVYTHSAIRAALSSLQQNLEENWLKN